MHSGNGGNGEGLGGGLFVFNASLTISNNNVFNQNLAATALPNISDFETVTNLTDGGLGSLRYFLTNGSNPTDIIFSSALSGKTNLLTAGPLVISNSLVIDSTRPAGRHRHFRQPCFARFPNHFQ